MRIPNRYLGLAAVVFLAATGVFADNPAVTRTPFPATGGDSVTGSGQWSVITNNAVVGSVNCPVQVYRQNYATMTWNLFETIGSVLAPTCTGGGFGESSSLSGNVLVVGIPNYDSTANFLTSCSPALTNRGAFTVYEFNGTTDWPRIDVGNCALNQVRVDTAVLSPPLPTPQANANYGFSVSVSRQGTTNDYIIAIGSPNFDGTAGRQHVPGQGGLSTATTQRRTPLRWPRRCWADRQR